MASQGPLADLPLNYSRSSGGIGEDNSEIASKRQLQRSKTIKIPIHLTSQVAVRSRKSRKSTSSSLPLRGDGDRGNNAPGDADRGGDMPEDAARDSGLLGDVAEGADMPGDGDGGGDALGIGDEGNAPGIGDEGNAPGDANRGGDMLEDAARDCGLLGDGAEGADMPEDNDRGGDAPGIGDEGDDSPRIGIQHDDAPENRAGSGNGAPGNGGRDGNDTPGNSSQDDDANSVVSRLKEIVFQASTTLWECAPYSFQLFAAVTWLKMLVSFFPTTSLLCQPTGKGKTHSSRLFGTVTGLIVIYIMPSLALAADQAKKFFAAMPGVAAALYLDAIDKLPNSCTAQKEAIFLLDSLMPSDDLFIPVITSPQALAKKHWRQAVIDRALERNILSAVVVDEPQLFVEFGIYFRPEFPALKQILFDKLQVDPSSGTNPNKKQKLRCPVILTTATFNSVLLDLFTKMTGLTLTPSTWMWAPTADMQRWELNLQFKYSPNFSVILKNRLRQFFDNDEDKQAKAIVYTNSHLSAEAIKEKIDEWNDEHSYFLGDVITIVGTLFPEQKFNRANVFAEKIDVSVAYKNDEPCPCIAIASAGTIGAGYDNSSIKAAYRHGFALSLANKIQEDGRNRAKGVALTVACLENYVYLLKRMYRKDLDEDQQVQESMCHVLSLDAQWQLQKSELMKVIRMMILDLGCWHAHLEKACGNPNDDNYNNYTPP